MCNSCENDCIQTLEVLQANIAVQDTNSVDMTIAGSTISSDVIHSPNGGTETTPTGIRIADCVFSQLTTPSDIESVVNTTNTGIYGTDSGFVTENIVARDNCRLRVFSPAEHTTISVALPAAQAVASQNAWNSGDTFTSAISQVIITNPTKRSMIFEYKIPFPIALDHDGTAPVRVRFEGLMDFNTGVLGITNTDYLSVQSNSAGQVMRQRLSKIANTGVFTVSAGGTYTLRVQSRLIYEVGTGGASQTSASVTMGGAPFIGVTV